MRVKTAYHIPGIVAGVWVPGQAPWKIATGFADMGSRRLISLEDRLPIRSVTKSYTVTLLLQLVRDKSVSLDDPIGKYVAGIPYGDLITLANLAGMESGVKSYSDTKEFLDGLVAIRAGVGLPGNSWTSPSPILPCSSRRRITTTATPTRPSSAWSWSR